MSRPGGQAAQPGSWIQAKANQPQNFVQHAGPRGQAAQPYAWLDGRPAYPIDQNRLAQDGMAHPGGRAAQGGSWIPAAKTSWTLAAADGSTAQQ